MDFYFAYWGNKRKELTHLLPYIDFARYDTICEPCGGSLAFSRYVFHFNPNKQFLCSDVDKNLISFCNNFRHHKTEIVDAVKKQMTSFQDDKDAYKQYISVQPQEEQEFLKWFLFYNTQFKLRRGMFPPKERHCKFSKYDERTKETDEFFSRVEYKCQDIKEALDTVRNDVRAFVYLDPPYPIKSDDVEYSENNIEHLWNEIFNFIDECKCSYIMSVDKNVWTDRVFKGIIVGEYEKRYAVSRGKGNKTRTTKHLIISNVALERL